MQSDMQRLKDMMRLSYHLDSELIYFQMLSLETFRHLNNRV